MADSGALRVRRARLHKGGDHSLCVRCVVQRADPVAAKAEPLPDDPVSGLRLLAGQLAAAYGRDTGNALLARELRMTLQALIPAEGKQADGDLDELFAALRT